MTPAGRVTLGLTVGSSLPLFPTAIGRMLLASAPRQVRLDYLAHCAPQKFTEKTLLRSEDILADIDTAETDGFCVVSEEFEPGITGIAVPVGHKEGVRGVVATTIPAGQDRTELREKSLSVLQICASNLARTQALT